MIRDIVTLPDPVLSRPTTEAGEITDEVRRVATDLLDTMRASSHSVGVAAPQIGESVRVCVVDVTGHPKAATCHGELVLVDPVIVEATRNERGREGCMSVPDLTGDVKRATRLVVTALDLDGHRITITTDAFEARAIQHEVDHLDGLLFLDRLSRPDRLFPRKIYR